MAAVASQSDAVEARYDRVARFYDCTNILMESFFSKHRKQLLCRARGHVLEVGVGTGNSFKDYPPGKQLTAVDISHEMFRRAKDKVKNFNGNVELRRENVERLPFRDEAFATIFTSCVFCSVNDPIKGLKELRRVLKKDGELLMLEHVRSKGRVLGYLMDKLNPLVTRYGVDNINRDTEENLRKAGFKIEQERNLAYDIVKAIVAVK